MNNNNIKKEISGLLETISEQAETIKNHQDKIPQLYLDIIKENIRKLYENIHNLDKLNNKPEIIISHEEKKEPKPEIAIDESTNEENNKPSEQSVAPIPKIKETTIDMFSDNKISIGEKLIDKQDNSIAAKMQKTQIIDLRTSIGINDKFLFINELFEGDMKNYNDAIDKLNSFNNLVEAIASLNLLKTEYNWDVNDEAFIKLNELIEGRYK